LYCTAAFMSDIVQVLIMSPTTLDNGQLEHLLADTKSCQY
jgi:hypothetical protein